MCQDAIEPEEHTTEITKGPDGAMYKLSMNGDHLTVDPWPLRLRSSKFFCEYQVIDQLTFKDAAAFKKCYQDTPARFKSWRLRNKPLIISFEYLSGTKNIQNKTLLCSNSLMSRSTKHFELYDKTLTSLWEYLCLNKCIRK